MLSDRKAFTLIELLIVVAIIAILAAIAVPNFLEAQTRSKVSRTRADMRSVAVALEAYATDNNRYPYVNQVPGWGLPAGPQPGVGIHAAGITTPIAYLTSLLKDPFGGKLMESDPYASYNTTREYWYGTQEYYQQRGFLWLVGYGAGDRTKAKWVLQSKGPDLHWAHNFNPPGVGEVDSPDDYQYDPTNGTISIGNIVRSGP